MFAVDMFVEFHIVFMLGMLGTGVGTGVGYKLDRFRIDVEGAINDGCFDIVGVCVRSREGTEVEITVPICIGPREGTEVGILEGM